MHNIGCSIDYSRILKLETHIAASVLNRINENGGVYVPPDLVPNSFIHCAADNLDFSEDTADGRRTLHGTVIAVYQAMEDSDILVPLSLVSPKECRLQSFDTALPNIIACTNPPNWKTYCPLPVLSITENVNFNIIQESVYTV